MNLRDLLRRGNKLYPERVAIRYQGRDYSYAEVNQRVNRLANSMLWLGLGHGDRIAILAQNCPQYVETYLASASLGVVTIPLNARLKGDELKYIINNGEAKALLVGPDFLEVVTSIKTDLPLVEYYIYLDQPASGFEEYESLLAEASAAEPAVELTQADVACQLYTSGTTGLPKGAMLTHRNVLSNAISCCLEQDIRPLDNYLMVLPLYHVAGYTLTLSALLMGGMLTIHPTFNPPEVLRSMVEDQITHAALVPVMMNFLLRMPNLEQYDFSVLKYIVYGASPITQALLEQVMGLFKCEFIQGYGLTEAAAFVSLLRPEDHVTDGSSDQIQRLSSVGREILGTEVKVVNEQGEEVAVDEVGEIVARGDNIMQGYWGMPEETAETLRNGWLHTGDLATVDEEGYIYIVDRKKDMIISGGENIYPREVENILLAHPAVADSAVIGIPDEVWGEAVKALVVLKEGETTTEEELIDFCTTRLASYKKPKSVEFRTGLPRNAMGKVLKRILREPYWEGFERRVH